MLSICSGVAMYYVMLSTVVVLLYSAVDCNKWYCYVVLLTIVVLECSTVDRSGIAM